LAESAYLAAHILNITVGLTCFNYIRDIAGERQNKLAANNSSGDYLFSFIL